MVEQGDRAPDFTTLKAGGDGYDDLETFRMSDEIGSGPIVLAFYPAAFTGGCTAEMCAFRDSMDEFENLEASVYGISVNLPYTQNVWIDVENLNFPMLSDWNHNVIHAYDVVLEAFDGHLELAQRSIFVINDDGTVRYKWIRSGENPNFDTFVPGLTDIVQEVR